METPSETVWRRLAEYLGDDAPPASVVFAKLLLRALGDPPIPPHMDLVDFALSQSLDRLCTPEQLEEIDSNLW